MASLSDCAAWVKATLGFNVGQVRIGCGLEVADMDLSSSYFDLGEKLSSLCRYAEVACAIGGRCRSLVLHVEASINVTKIVDAVVRMRAVDVVYLTTRPLSMNVEPCEAMRSVGGPVYANFDVPATVIESKVSTRLPLASGATVNAARETACRAVVVQYFAQSLRRKIRHSHEALQLLIGQRLARVSARGGLRHFHLEIA